MDNPWEEIDLSAYEKHMSLSSVFQLQALSKMMKDQFYAHPVQSIMILGVAGGNGLEHIDRQVFHKVYGVDINRNYLDKCVERHPELQGVFEPICTDLTKEICKLPYADLVVADLVIEYIGYKCFQSAIRQVSPRYVSAIIQINMDGSYVSDSPFLHIFDRLDEVHHRMEETALVDAMEQIGYKKEARAEAELPNGKRLVRLGFAS